MMNVECCKIVTAQNCKTLITFLLAILPVVFEADVILNIPVTSFKAGGLKFEKKF